MRISKVSDRSSLDSYFETMDRFNKRASRVSSLSGLFDIAKGAGKFKSIDLSNATHLVELLGKSKVTRLNKILLEGDDTMLKPFLREADDDVAALVYKSVRDGNPEVLTDSAKYLSEARSDYKAREEIARHTSDLPPPKSPKLLPPPKSPPAAKVKKLDPNELAALKTFIEKTEEGRVFLHLVEGAPEVGNKLIKKQIIMHKGFSAAGESIRAGADEGAETLLGLKEEVSLFKEVMVEIFRRIEDIADSQKNLSKALLDRETLGAAEIAAKESQEAAAKVAKETIESIAQDLAKLLETTKGGVKPATTEKAIDGVSTAVVETVKVAEEAGKSPGILGKILGAGFAVKALKVLGGLGLLGGVAYLGNKYLRNGDNGDSDLSETPGSRSGVGGGPSEGKVSAEDAIKSYLETGDTAALAGILDGSQYSNLMIFPKPIDGLSFAFFDSGRLRSPDERILIPTNPETQAIMNSLLGTAGGKVLDYERSKASSPQIALNKTVQAIYQYGFYATPLGNTRASKYIMGRAFKPFPRRGFLGRNAERISPAERRERRPGRRMTASDNANRLGKLDILNKISTDKSTSTNNHQNTDVTLFKEADETSKSYCKDAVKDLNNNDKSIREYFAGLGRLYDDKSEKPKTDFSSLYNITEGSGSELTHEAHPKAIVVLDSIGNGGLVENGLEQKEQNQGVAMSTPTGNYRSNYAWVRNMLEKKGTKTT